MDFDVVRLHSHGQARPGSKHGVYQRGGDVHLRDRIAEFVGLRLRQLDRPVAEHRALMPSGSRRDEIAEDLLEQPILKQAIGLRRELVAAAIGALDSLPLGHFAH